MTVSRARSCLAGVALLASSSWITASWAQSPPAGTPQNLAPQNLAPQTLGPRPPVSPTQEPPAGSESAAPAPIGAPTRFSPPPAGSTAPQPAIPPLPLQPAGTPAPDLPAQAGRGASAGGVTVDTLSAVDPDSIGVLDSDTGGLGAAMWDGTPRDFVERLLPKLPAGTNSRTARDLMRRLLLSRAQAPKGAAGPVSLLALRTERLVAMGEIDGALSLLQVAPPNLRTEDMALTEVEGMFFRNDNAGACTRVRGMGNQYNKTYWREADAFCLILAGDKARALLIADLLRERGAAVEKAFFAAVEALQGDQQASVDSLADPKGLTLAMMRASGLRLPADVATARQPSVYRAVAASPNADIALRLEAAEKALATGVIGSEMLFEIYASLPFTPDELANPLASAGAEWGPRARALLVRAAAATQGSVTVKAEMLRRSWQLAREKGGADIFLREAAPIFAQIPPAPELMWFAEDAVRALMAAGNLDAALDWVRLTADEAERSDEARTARLAVWPLAQLARGAAGAETSADAGIWLAAHLSREAADRRQTATAILNYMTALGQPVASELWTKLVDADSRATAERPGLALRAALAASAEAGKPGETVLLALITLGAAPLAEVSPVAVAEVVRALRTAGFAREAAALAVEAAIASGV